VRVGPALSAARWPHGSTKIPEVAMQVIGLFVLLVFALNAVAVVICAVVESYSAFGSLIVFLVMYACNFVIAWKVALYLTERYFVSDNRQDVHDHAGMARSNR
jgi:membrane protein YdbS with pleckstrin-like domain